MESVDVIIVGAGASGLLAAKELSKAGKKVLVLEARNRIGGRIYPLPDNDFGYEAQGGAEFIHGEAAITKGLVQEAGLTLTNPTEWWSVSDGEPKKIENNTPNDPLLMEAFAKLDTDMSVQEFLETYFFEDQFAFLRDYVCRWVEGYDAADPARASVFCLRDEMTNKDGWQQQNLKEGYGALIRYLKNECEKSGVEILLNTEVSVIDYTDTMVAVRCKDDSVYQARKVLITVPLPLIRTLQFVPSLQKKIADLEKMGFGFVIKILIRFKTKWWTGVRENIFERMFFLISREKVPTWWTQYPEKRTVLTGWAPVSKARALKVNSDEEIKDIALRSLSNIFNITFEQLREEVVHYKIVNWPQDPYARGAYSYMTPESSDVIREFMKPVDDRIYFCGEAFTKGSALGTVEGAFASAMETVVRM